MADRKPIKAASGVATEFGAGDTIALANGGTGQTTAALAIEALLAGLSATQGVIPYRGSSAWAALATGTAGQVLTSGGAGANPSWSNSLIKVKTATEAIASTTLQDDDHLTISVVAGVNYFFYLRLSTNGYGANGFKCDFTVPSGASGTYDVVSIRDNNSSYPAQTRGNTIGTPFSNTFHYNQIWIFGYLENPTNSGSFTLRWAESAASGTVTMAKGSTMQLFAV